MGAKSGLALKFLQWFIRGIQFLCAALILGIYAYFLASLHNHSLPIDTSVRAVTGISGAAALYTLVGLLLLCCVAGLAFTSFIAMVLDFCFIGCFIYVAVVNKHGAGSCTGYVDTPFGQGRSDAMATGNKDGFTALPSFHTACRLQTASMAVAIIAIFFFILSMLMEVALVRHHRKEKRFGPPPATTTRRATQGAASSVASAGTRIPRRWTRPIACRSTRTRISWTMRARAMAPRTRL